MHGHPLNIPRSNTGRFESTPASTGYHLPVTPTSKTHHTGADSTDSVASSLSSCGSSIPPPSPGDILYSDSRNSSRDRLKSAASPTTQPCAMPFKDTLTTIKTPGSIGKIRSHSIQQNINNPGERESLNMPPPSEYQKDAQTKSTMHAKGSESMQNIPGNEVNIYHSTSDDFYSGSSTSLISQKPISQMQKVNNGCWVEGTTVMTQSECRSSSSYISTFTSVTTSTRAAIISDCVDGSKTNQNDKISNLILCQSPVPNNNNRKQEQCTTFSMHHSSQDELNRHHATISKTGLSPTASPNSPINIHELNAGESGAIDALGGSTTVMPVIGTLQVPKSPRTPSMGHVIRHRFTKTIKPAKCDFCSVTMFRGLKCKECKFKCHIDCETNVPPSCGLPEEMVKYYFNHLSKENSPILTRPISDSVSSGNSKGGAQGSYYGSPMNPSHPNKPYPDSSSNTSSCNSSTPSSPAVILDHITTNPTPPHSATIYPRGSSHFDFTFPNTGQTVVDPPPQLGKNVSSTFQQDSALLGATSGSTNVYQQITQYTTHQQLQQISPPQQAPSQNPRSPNPLIISIQSNDSDKTLSSKLI